MSKVIIQAQEQKGLKNQDYPNGYYPFFNGNPKNQTQILKKLLDNGYEIMEYSVPKAGLLESLFIELTKANELGGAHK